MVQPVDAIDWTRWVFYLLAGVPLLGWLFFSRDRVLRLVAVVAVLMFLQDSIIGRRYIWGFSVAPSFMLLYVAIVAEVLAQRRLPSLGVYAPLWLGFLFFAASNIVIGSIGTGLWALNVKQFQVYYFEGFFFFLYGIIALRNHDELHRFTRWSILIGLGVALIHVFSIATGFRFRNAVAEHTSGVYYAGVLDNTNSLGSYYTMLLPVALSLAVGPRQSSFWRFATIVSIVGMLGSLLLSASRGGVLFSVAMCFVALSLSRFGVGRALVAMILAGVTVAMGYVLLQVFAGSAVYEISGLVAEEGLETNRFFLFARYLQMLFDHPLGIGVAVENFSLKLPAYGIPGVVSAHNIYLDIPLQTGIPGLLMFVGICGLLLWRNWRAMHLTDVPAERNSLVFVFLPVLGFLAIGFFEPIFTISNKLNNLFWILCGLSVAASQRVFAARRAAREAEPMASSPLLPPPHAQRV